MIIASRLMVIVVVCAMACAPAIDEPKSRFAPQAPGTVVDVETGLVWTSENSSRDLPWPEANTYCRTLNIGGADDWRLPTIQELHGLYDENAEQPCGDRVCGLAPSINIDTRYVWSSSTRGGASRFYLDFGFGTQLSPLIRPTLVRRVLCARGAVHALE
jgi:hypothetical protein